MKIGVFGGSFDPVHTGHATVVNELSQCGLFDQIWMIPARVSPFKAQNVRHATPGERVEMCRLVAEKCAAARVDDIETKMPEPSYTYKTLCELKRRYPEHQFRVIIGSDNLTDFSKWYDAEGIVSDFGVTVYPRPGYNVPASLPENVNVVEEVPQVLVSSTYIRRGLAKGKNVNFLVPDSVLQYIKEKKLYLGDGSE